jgi:tetratricopeptide (TPR) repeat protein
LLIEQAEAAGEPPEDKLLLFSVLFGFWVTNYVAFNGDVMRELAAQFLALAKKQGATGLLITGHGLTGTSLLCTGAIAQARTHFDRAIPLYDPAEHRPFAARFGQDLRVTQLAYRSLALWMLGYPDAALADANVALKDAREINQAATLMFMLLHASFTHTQCGHYAKANAEADEAVALADEKGALFWKPAGIVQQGCILALTGQASEAVHMITSGITTWRSTGATLWMPLNMSYLASAYAELRSSDDAWRCIDEASKAVETTKEKW